MTNTLQKDAHTGDDISNPNTLGWLLVGSGFTSMLIMLIRGYRKIIGWLLPIGLITAGITLLFQQRQVRIERVEDNIRSELDTLDPVARAQIIAKIAEKEINTYRKPKSPN